MLWRSAGLAVVAAWLMGCTASPIPHPGQGDATGGREPATGPDAATAWEVAQPPAEPDEATCNAFGGEWDGDRCDLPSGALDGGGACDAAAADSSDAVGCDAPDGEDAAVPCDAGPTPRGDEGGAGG